MGQPPCPVRDLGIFVLMDRNPQSGNREGGFSGQLPPPPPMSSPRGGVEEGDCPTTDEDSGRDVKGTVKGTVTVKWFG